MNEKAHALDSFLKIKTKNEGRYDSWSCTDNVVMNHKSREYYYVLLYCNRAVAVVGDRRVDSYQSCTD